MALDQQPTSYTAGPDQTDDSAALPYSYNASSPFFRIGAAGAEQNILIDFDPDSPHLIKIVTINPQTGAPAHQLHVNEHWRVTANTIFDWHEELWVPDGSGGWMPSPAGNGLKCAGYGNPWPAPTASPTPSSIAFTEDAIAMVWTGGLPDGTNIMIDKYVLVPAGTKTFALVEFPTPEPASMGLVGVGLGLLCIRSRRKR